MPASRHPPEMSPVSPAPRWLAVLAIAAVLAGAYFRLANLESKVVWLDEVFTWQWISGYRLDEIPRQSAAKGLLAPEDFRKLRGPSPDRRLADALRNLARNAPQNPPGYFAAAWVWTRCLGESAATLRALSAAFGILCAPLVFWLCIELFRSRAVAAAAAAIFALSPYHVLLAQEARPYSLWFCLAVLASALLLRALRLRTRAAWALYAAAATGALYASLLAAFVLLGHGIYVLLATGRERPRAALAAWSLAALGAAAALAPWGYAVAKHFRQVRNGLAWQSIGVPADVYLARAVSCFGQAFFDIAPWRAVYALPAVLLIAWGMVVLLRETPRRISAFVLALGAPVALALLGADAVAGGQRFMAARYLQPAFLAAQLAVAYLLATRAEARPRAWGPALVLVLGASAVSCVAISRADTWWTKADYTRAVDRTVAGAARPLVIVEADPLRLCRATSLSYYCDARVRFLIAARPDVDVPGGFSDVFVLEPSDPLRRVLETGGRRLEPAAPGCLWRLEKAERRP